jgi:hypothetical protein
VPAIYGKVVTPPFLRLTHLPCCNGILQGEPSPVGNVDKTSVIHVIHSAKIQQTKPISDFNEGWLNQ